MPKKSKKQPAKAKAPPLERDSKKILARLKREGWIVDRIKGSHHQLKHPNRKKIITLSHPTKSLPTGTARQIHKTAGWL